MLTVYQYHLYYSKKQRKKKQIGEKKLFINKFSYTLVLTYNLWRNYPLSTFFEYIFLFIQGREKNLK